MIAFLNGQFLEASEARVSIFDRGFLYGDGLFETVPFRNGRLFRAGQYLERLQRGAALLRIALPHAPEELAHLAGELISRNHLRNGLLRLQLTRGAGERGYSPRGANSPTLVMTLHPAPETDPARPPVMQLITASPRLPAPDPIAAVKSCNKLPQILARAEAESAGADEALLLNTLGEVAEASSGNVFWIDSGVIHTPPLSSGALAGITRAVLLELCASLGLKSREASLEPEALQQMEGVFLSLSSRGVVEVVTLDNHGLNTSPLVTQLHAAYQALVDRECA